MAARPAGSVASRPAARPAQPGDERPQLRLRPRRRSSRRCPPIASSASTSPAAWTSKPRTASAGFSTTTARRSGLGLRAARAGRRARAALRSTSCSSATAVSRHSQRSSISSIARGRGCRGPSPAPGRFTRRRDASGAATRTRRFSRLAVARGLRPVRAGADQALYGSRRARAVPARSGGRSGSPRARPRRSCGARRHRSAGTRAGCRKLRSQAELDRASLKRKSRLSGAARRPSYAPRANRSRVKDELAAETAASGR